MNTYPLIGPPSRRKRRRGTTYRLPDPDFTITKDLMKVPTDIYLTEVQRARIIESRQERVSYFMRLGFSETRIAEELGVSAFTAHEDCVKVREMWRQSTLENVEAAAVLDLTRLDFIIRGQLQAAEAGDAEAAGVCLKAIQERGMIFGYRSGIEIDIEGHLREQARLAGFDEERAVELAAQIRMRMQ